MPILDKQKLAYPFSYAPHRTPLRCVLGICKSPGLRCGSGASCVRILPSHAANCICTVAGFHPDSLWLLRYGLTLTVPVTPGILTPFHLTLHPGRGRADWSDKIPIKRNIKRTLYHSVLVKINIISRKLSKPVFTISDLKLDGSGVMFSTAVAASGKLGIPLAGPLKPARGEEPGGQKTAQTKSGGRQSSLVKNSSAGSVRAGRFNRKLPASWQDSFR